MSVDIFKLIYEHDLRLDQLRERKLDRSTQETGSSIEDFLKPDPTYSKFYITGTVLNKELFGLNRIQKFGDVVDALDEALQDYDLYFEGATIDWNKALKKAEIGKALILTRQSDNQWESGDLDVDDSSNVGHKKILLADVLESGDLVLYKEKAHQGFDLHLFSRDNIYPKLFEACKKLLSPKFRFFSVNGRRVRSERKFYFETWTLNRPPHGAEEVFPSTRI